MSKQVQIDYELFLDLLRYFIQEDTDEMLFEDIAAALEGKLDKMITRELFTEYKRAATRQEREAARQKYLDHVGIHPSFRTKTECQP